MLVGRIWDFPGGSVVKNLPAVQEKQEIQFDLWVGRTPGGGHGYPLQCSCLESPMDRSLAGYSPWGRKELNTTEGIEHTHRKNSGLPSGTSGKEPTHQCRYVRDLGSIPGSGRRPGGRHG